MPVTPLNPAAAAHLAAMMSRAEQRRATLEELTQVGMVLAKDIAQRSIESPYYPEPKRDPGRAFGAASRAVRLTLAMEAKVDEQILAWCNGDFVAADALGACRPLVFTRGDAAADRSADADDQEIGDLGETDPRVECERESLIERTPRCRGLSRRRRGRPRRPRAECGEQRVGR